MNMSFATNLLALAVTLGGYLSPVHGELIFTVGLFALSGGITNWLAVHMLFEKVPLLYGSGVIPSRFQDFKAGIKSLIIEEFFTRAHIERFFREAGDRPVEQLAEKVDFDRVFVGLTDAIEKSQLGGMLSMIGGKKALEPLRAPVTNKLREIISDLAEEGLSKGGSGDFTDMLIEKVEHIIDNRLEELTPENVKTIVQDMIRKHLGWLVVWGGVFGGVIGALVGLLKVPAVG
ncbi:DUF445 domain-containing protein [Gimesia sp.]|uniref:DUF445 domain-containing protein n=1 Tax=Gimesia sp. TaxID=2024833 RepID=UPI003A919453